VARAKKTDRAEARRRTRLAAAAAEEEAAASGTTSDAAAAAPKAPVPSGARPSIGGIFRDAIRPVDIRQDLRQIRWLVTKTNAVWLPSLLVVVGALWFGANGGTIGALPYLVFNFVVFPPPLAVTFLAGILTDRMSYMAGLLVGIVDALVFGLYMALGPVGGVDLTADQRGAYIMFGLAISPISGLAIGGFAGFYRRFLRRANPNAGARQQQRNKTTKAAARR
jgi:hypothetical protein